MQDDATSGGESAGVDIGVLAAMLASTPARLQATDPTAPPPPPVIQEVPLSRSELVGLTAGVLAFAVAVAAAWWRFS